MQIFAVLAFVMAGISPACAFASGKGILQICKDDGSVAYIIVTPEMDPFYDPAFNPAAPVDTNLEMRECSFCFAANHTPALSAYQMILAPIVSANNDQFYDSAHPVHWRDYRNTSPRAPPLTFV